MSRDALQWAGQQSVGRSTGKLVLLGLAKCADRDGLAWPSLGYLAEFAGVSVRAVRYELRRLRAGGWIEDSGDRRGQTRQIKVWRLRTNEPVLPLFANRPRRLNGRQPKAELGFPLSRPAKAETRFRLSSNRKAELNGRKGGNGLPPEYIESSDTNVSAGKPADPIKELFDLGVALLTGSGVAESRARTLVGSWRKGGRDGEVAVAFAECQSKGITDPLSWLSKRLQGPRFVSASGHEYRGTLEQIRREAERRSDNNTYWAVTRELREQAKGKG